MPRFEPGQAVEQFGDVRFDGDLAAVRKQSCLLPFSGLGGGDDRGATYSDGNSLGLVNTKVRRCIAVLLGRGLVQGPTETPRCNFFSVGCPRTDTRGGPIFQNEHRRFVFFWGGGGKEETRLSCLSIMAIS